MKKKPQNNGKIFEKLQKNTMPKQIGLNRLSQY